MGRNNADFHADVDRALQDYKITDGEANDLKGLPWEGNPRHFANQKSYIKDVHKNAGLNNSGKEW